MSLQLAQNIAIFWYTTCPTLFHICFRRFKYIQKDTIAVIICKKNLPGAATAGRPPSPKVGQWGGGLKSKKHPDRKWWFNCWESTPCNMVTDLDVGNSARMMEFPICDEFSGERFWPILIRTSLEVTLRGGSICKSCQNGWHQTGYSNSITQIGYDG